MLEGLFDCILKKYSSIGSKKYYILLLWTRGALAPLHQTLIFGFKEGNWLGYNQHLDFFGRNLFQ